MAVVYVNKEKCPQDHSCPALKYCPAGAIIQQEYNAPKVLEDKCIECGKCIKVCPKGVFQFKK